MTWAIQFLHRFSKQNNPMKKKSSNHHELKEEQEHEQELEDRQKQLEILKAVAQAWHSHSGNSKPANEFDAYRRNFKANPSRFKLEGINRRKKASNCDRSFLKWDFRQSLWDSYEIVAVSKRLERGLVVDDDDDNESFDGGRKVGRRKRESNNSLRNLFNRVSSRRFNE